jgi:hypothetical protein
MKEFGWGEGDEEDRRREEGKGEGRDEKLKKKKGGGRIRKGEGGGEEEIKKIRGRGDVRNKKVLRTNRGWGGLRKRIEKGGDENVFGRDWGREQREGGRR